MLKLLPVALLEKVVFKKLSCARGRYILYAELLNTFLTV